MSTPDPKNPSGDTHERKSGLSCAECRRSKLKCDRVFPCQSCVRRGCANICPNGTLAATKGNKVLMAHADKLSGQVKALTKRVHELESALQSRHTEPVRDAMDPTDCSPEECSDDMDNTSDAFDLLSIGPQGQLKYHGETADYEGLLPFGDEPWPPKAHNTYNMPMEIIELINSFPLGIRTYGFNKHLFHPYIPPKSRAVELAGLYFQHAGWMYNPVTQDDFMVNVIDPIYGQAGVVSLDPVHSHTLSLFFVILANGVLSDNIPDPVSFSNQYLVLSRAALASESIIEEATCATVQALFMICQYDFHFNRTSTEERWLLHGLCIRVAQRIGLHRDSPGYTLDPEELRRRRNLFWEIYVYDGWTSIADGRPPVLDLQYTDCRFPDDYETRLSGGEKEMRYHAFMHRYAASCLSATARYLFSARPLAYQGLLALDKKIQQYPVPPNLQMPVLTSTGGQPWPKNPVTATQQCSVALLKETNLLYLHRSYFGCAVRENSEDPLKHKFGESVISTYHSACRIVASLRSMYESHQEAAKSCWCFWSSLFSSCVIFGAIVIECPRCPLASDAMADLERALPFYEEGSSETKSPSTLLILRNLRNRAQESFRTGATPSHVGIRRDLELLGGLPVLQSRKSQMHGGSTHQSLHCQKSLPSGCHTSDSLSASDCEPQSDAIDYYQAFGNPLLESSYLAFNVSVPENSHNVPACITQVAGQHFGDPQLPHAQIVLPCVGDIGQTYDIAGRQTPSDSYSSQKDGLFYHPTQSVQAYPSHPTEQQCGRGHLLPVQPETWNDFVNQFGV